MWALLSKRNLLTWKNSSKKVIIKSKSADTVVELSADRALFGRMIIASKTRADINILDILATYELSIVPWALFALDGRMHHISSKSS